VIKDDEKSTKSSIEKIEPPWLAVAQFVLDFVALEELTPHQVSSSWSHA
jgi:hypothetical protein